MHHGPRPPMGGAADTARAAWSLGDIHWKGVVFSFEVVLWRQAPLRMYLFETAKGRNRPRAISKIVKWVPIVLCS